MIGEGFELGEARDIEDPTPGDSSDETWHVHEPVIRVEIPELGGSFPSSWGTGIKCDACAKPKPEHGGGKTVRFMIERLRQHREAGTSAVGMEKEIIDSARADGRLDKIDRAR